MTGEGWRSRRVRVTLGLIAAMVLSLALVALVATRDRPVRRRRSPVGVSAASRPVPLLPTNSLRGLTIVIDPGHGGHDPGAQRRGVTEASLTYRTAAELAVVLRDAGAEVRLTATSRSALDLDLDQRNPAAEPPLIRPVDARLADDPTTVVMSGRADPSWLHRRAGLASGADVFVSLHYDVRPRSSERGALVLVDRRTRPAPACARATARRLAADLRGGTLRPRTLGVLSPDHNPVAQRYLVEIGVLTNRVERRLMQQSRWRWRTARLLAWAIVDCRRAVARSKAAASESAVSRNARAAGAGRPASRTAGRTMTRSPT